MARREGVKVWSVMDLKNIYIGGEKRKTFCNNKDREEKHIYKKDYS